MDKKNIYFNILKIYINKNDISVEIKNINKNDITIIEDDKDIILRSDNCLKINMIGDKLKIRTNDEINEFNLNLKNNDLRGFDKDCVVETPTGRRYIKDIIAGDHILDKNGNPLLVTNVYVFTIDNTSTNKPICIEKSKCGLNLPYSNLIMSMKSNLKIKKVTLKGRSLYLNGKAKIVDFKESFNYYSLETYNKKEYLINGFVTDSI
tara:strand:- start:1185 stop:1805 length:621 start_codon:yes stop_codon:yes gene_type:complete